MSFMPLNSFPHPSTALIPDFTVHAPVITSTRPPPGAGPQGQWWPPALGQGAREQRAPMTSTTAVLEATSPAAWRGDRAGGSAGHGGRWPTPAELGEGVRTGLHGAGAEPSGVRDGELGGSWGAELDRDGTKPGCRRRAMARIESRAFLYELTDMLAKSNGMLKSVNVYIFQWYFTEKSCFNGIFSKVMTFQYYRTTFQKPEFQKCFGLR